MHIVIHASLTRESANPLGVNSGHGGHPNVQHGKPLGFSSGGGRIPKALTNKFGEIASPWGCSARDGQ